MSIAKIIQTKEVTKKILQSLYKKAVQEKAIGGTTSSKRKKFLEEILILKESLQSIEKDVSKALSLGASATEIRTLAGKCQGNVFVFSGTLNQRIHQLEMEKLLGKPAPKKRDKSLLSTLIKEMNQERYVSIEQVIQLKKLIRENQNKSALIKNAMEHIILFELSRLGFTGRITFEGLKGKSGLPSNLNQFFNDALHKLIKEKKISITRKGIAQTAEMYQISTRELIQKYSPTSIKRK